MTTAVERNGRMRRLVTFSPCSLQTLQKSSKIMRRTVVNNINIKKIEFHFSEFHRSINAMGPVQKKLT